MFARALRSAAPTLSRASLSPLVVRQVARPASILRSAVLAASSPTGLRSYSDETPSPSDRHTRPGPGPRKSFPPSNRVFVANLPEGTNTDGQSSRPVSLIDLAWAAALTFLLPPFAGLLAIGKEYGGALQAFVGTKDDGSYRRFGFITFSSIEDATAAIPQLVSRPTDGEPLAADFAEGPEARRRRERESTPASNKLYIGNLAKVDTTDLEAVIEPLLKDNPFELTRGYYRDTGVLHPFAFLRFRDIDSASKAKRRLSNVQVGDVGLIVNFPMPKDEASRRPRERGGRDGYASRPAHGRCVALLSSPSCLIWRSTADAFLPSASSGPSLPLPSSSPSSDE
jgi:RNA recognition motif-containing protein